MLAAQFRLSDEKKYNSADGTINKPTTNIYWSWHWSFTEKFQGLEKLGLENFGGLIFSPIRWESDKSGKTAR